MLKTSTRCVSNVKNPQSPVRFNHTKYASDISGDPLIAGAGFRYFVTLTFRAHITNQRTVIKYLNQLFIKVRRSAYGKSTSLLKDKETSPLMAIWGIEKCRSGLLHVHICFSEPPPDSTKNINIVDVIYKKWSEIAKNPNIDFKFPGTQEDQETVIRYTLKAQDKASDAYGLEGWKIRKQ